MKKLFLFAWLMMLSIAAMAQTIVVVNKDGNKATFDPSEVTSIDFQSTPPGFTVNWNDASRQYTFNEVQSVKGLPDYLFADPKVVNVSLASTEGSEAIFAAEVKTNVEYDVKTSDPWIKVARKEADRLVCNVLQRQGNDRKGYVALASKDGLLTDTIKVYLNDEFYVLKCLTPLQSITTVGTAKFMLIEIVNGALRPAAGKTISFSAENGTCSVKEAVTDAQGMVSVDFIPSSENIDRGSVQASFRGYFNGVSMIYTSTAIFAVEEFELKCQPKQYFWKDGAVTVEFQLVKYDKGTRKPVRATDINFTCENGTLNAQSKQTDEEGKVTVDFAPDKNFKTGSVTASCKVQLVGGSYWFGNATTEVIKGEEYMLEALTPEIHLCGDNFGEIPVQFRLLKYDFEKDEWEPSGDKTIKFTAVNGVAGSTSAVSDVDGIVIVTFQPDQGFVEGSLTASCDIDLPDGNKWHGEAVTKFMTDLYKIERILPWNADAVDYYIGKPWDCEFQLLKKEGNGYVPCPYQYIQFEATNGSCTPDYALTDAEGKVQATYTMDDDKDNGSLKASFSFTDAEGNVCIGSVTTNFFLDKYDLKCLTPEVEVKQSEIVEIRFQLFEYKGRGKWEPCPDKTITFTAKNGICTPEWTKTNAEGIATVRFSPTSTDVTEGVVQAECGITLDPKTGLEWRAAELALITITESYKLECLTKEVEIKKGETADIRFRLMEFEEGKWVTCSGVVNFTAENGTSNPEWMQADDDGLTHATFIPAADATEGTLTGFISIIINDKATMTWSDVAHITIIDDTIVMDAGLIKAYNLKDNTVAFDGDELPITFKEGFYEKYVYTGWNEYPEDYEHPKGRFQVNWIALKNYLSEKVVNDVWKKNRIYMRGQADDIPEVILSLEDEGHQSNWVPGSNRDYDKENDLLYSNVAYVEWEADADKFEKYAQRWREQQEGYDPREEGWKYQYPELPEPPEDLFAKWTYEVKSVKAAPSNDFGWGTKYMKHIGYTNRGFTYYPWNPNDSPNGKDFFFEEANQFVYIAYRIMPNGDDAYVKVVFPKDSSEFQYKEIKY